MTRPMTRSSETRGMRRWLAFSLPPFVVLCLVLVGRRVAVSDAAAASSSVVVGPPIDAFVEAAATAIDGGVASTDAGPEAARPALEMLADGAVMVDLNLATEEELRRLPGIGPGRARKIVELRTRLGRLKSIDDLARIKGFGRALIKRIRPLAKTS